MLLLTVVGARPQFIKAATVSKALSEGGAIDEYIVHTGQHFDKNMSDVFFEQLGLRAPDNKLDIHGGPHGEMTGRMLTELERVMLEVGPDRVLVYGDTNSTLAGALAAAKLHIPVAHVEAGLRSFDRKMPEEINRVLTDHIADKLYCPTKAAVENLQREGRHEPHTHVELVGDVMLDASQLFRPASRRPVGVDLPDRFVLATVHRAENTDDPAALAGIADALSRTHRELEPVAMPLHPRTATALAAHGLTLDVIKLPPVGYLEMLWLLEHASVVATDSGGVQKEAYFFGKPCVTMRTTTEWVELVDAGVNVLAGSTADGIVDAIRSSLGAVTYVGVSLYGDGSAAHLVARSMVETPK